MRPEVLTEPGLEANAGLSAPGRWCSAGRRGASSGWALPGAVLTGPEERCRAVERATGWVIHRDLAAPGQGPQV